MKNFKDFSLYGTKENLQKFKDNIDYYITGDWKKGNESQFKDNSIAFCYVGKEVNKSTVYLYIKNINEFKFEVINIIPMVKNSLNYDEYNEVLEKCVNDCIIPCAEKYDLSYTLTSGNDDLEDYMSKESAMNLRIFSSSANKSTGSSHPCDRSKWNKFICEAFKNNDDNVISILGRWLVEEEGWDDESASKLVIEFEQGISLLLYYKENCYE